MQDVLVGAPKWEGKIVSLYHRHREELSDQLKLPIFMNMMPKEYQDVGMQMSIVVSFTLNLGLKILGLGKSILNN